MNLGSNWQAFQIRTRAQSWLRRIASSPNLRIEEKFTRFAGINHHNFLVGVRDADGLDNDQYYLLRLPGDAVCYRDQPGASIRQSMIKEAETLRRLQGKLGEFIAPECVLFEEEAPEFGGQPALLMTACPGMALDQKVLRPRAEELCEMIGKGLASIHNLDSSQFDHLHGYESRQAHLRAELSRIPSKFLERDRDARRAYQFVESLLRDRDSPPTVVHGDPLPQNIIHPLYSATAHPAIVDWEFARIGDPAYDFAVLFRGQHKLFGLLNGRSLVTQAYKAAGGLSIQPRRIDAHEAALLLFWLSRGAPQQQQVREQLLNVVRRY